jgi:hypothetical protein
VNTQKQAFTSKMVTNLDRSLSPILGDCGENFVVQTFVFSHLPIEEKKRFMDFLIEN